MTSRLLSPLLAVAFAAGTILTSGSAFAAPDLLEFKAADDQRIGKKVVLLSGDEEYRSEESCPMLAKILTKHHGFDTVVLFSINPDIGNKIDPNFHGNTPGLDHLKTADLLIIGTRFRELPPEQYEHLAAFLNAGKPVIGFRTATHAFTGDGKAGDFAWKDFGSRILGEGWVAHHGKHGTEGTRGVVEPQNALHPILNGVYDVFGPSDVYTIDAVTSENATILMRGAVTESLSPASPTLRNDDRNKPMQPAAWLRQYTAPNGKAKGQAFCTTLGSSVDFLSADLRRLIVNACFHLTGKYIPEEANVDFVDPFRPTMFGKKRSEGYYKNLGLTPDSFDFGGPGSQIAVLELQEASKSKTAKKVEPAKPAPKAEDKPETKKPEPTPKKAVTEPAPQITEAKPAPVPAPAPEQDKKMVQPEPKNAEPNPTPKVEPAPKAETKPVQVQPKATPAPQPNKQGMTDGAKVGVAAGAAAVAAGAKKLGDNKKAEEPKPAPNQEAKATPAPAPAPALKVKEEEAKPVVVEAKKTEAPAATADQPTAPAKEEPKDEATKAEPEPKADDSEEAVATETKPASEKSGMWSFGAVILGLILGTLWTIGAWFFFLGRHDGWGKAGPTLLGEFKGWLGKSGEGDNATSGPQRAISSIKNWFGALPGIAKNLNQFDERFATPTPPKTKGPWYKNLELGKPDSRFVSDAEVAEKKPEDDEKEPGDDKKKTSEKPSTKKSTTKKSKSSDKKK